jgi:hypothetical protein
VGTFVCVHTEGVVVERRFTAKYRAVLTSAERFGGEPREFPFYPKLEPPFTLETCGKLRSRASTVIPAYLLTSPHRSRPPVGKGISVLRRSAFAIAVPTISPSRTESAMP